MLCDRLKFCSSWNPSCPNFFYACEWCWRMLTCPALLTSWLGRHVYKVYSDTSKVGGFVFPMCNTCCKDLWLSGKGWVFWDRQNYQKHQWILSEYLLVCKNSGLLWGPSQWLWEWTNPTFIWVSKYVWIWFIVCGSLSQGFMVQNFAKDTSLMLMSVSVCIASAWMHLRKWRVSEKETSPFCGVSAAEQYQELYSFWNKDFEMGVPWKTFIFRLLPYCDPSCQDECPPRGIPRFWSMVYFSHLWGGGAREKGVEGAMLWQRRAPLGMLFLVPVSLEL